MVQIENLKFGYTKKKLLFENLNLNLKAGNIYGLLGRNGAGKTSLLKIIAGLRFPQAGICSFMGVKCSTRNPILLSEIFFISEDFSVPQMRIDSYVNLYAPFYKRFDQQALNSYLKEFELESQAELAKLSFGQKKKFLIAFGMAANPSLFILDEPTNGLDIPAKSQFRKLLAQAASDDKCILISAHQVRDLQTLIDPIFILDAGQIIFSAALAEVQKAFKVSFSPNEPKAEDVIYAEKVLGGFILIQKNLNEPESNIDLELLFNAVIQKRHLILKELRKE